MEIPAFSAGAIAAAMFAVTALRGARATIHPLPAYRNRSPASVATDPPSSRLHGQATEPPSRAERTTLWDGGKGKRQASISVGHIVAVRDYRQRRGGSTRCRQASAARLACGAAR